jgi:hypothetical protein
MIKNPKDFTNLVSASVVETLKRAHRERREREAIYRDTKRVVENALKPDAETFAARVLAAAAKARGEVTDETPRFSNDEHGRRAKAICNAGRRARGLEEFK